MQTLQFRNEQLDISQLPEVKQEAFTKLEKRYIYLIYTRWIFSLLVALGIFTFFWYKTQEQILPWVYLSILGVILLWNIYRAIIIKLGFPIKSYLMRDKDISYQSGIIFYQNTTVPFNRIQHVEINQGALAKIFKLASLKIYTAGGSASDLSIPGLKPDTAAQLKEFLSKTIAEHE